MDAVELAQPVVFLWMIGAVAHDLGDAEIEALVRGVDDHHALSRHDLDQPVLLGLDLCRLTLAEELARSFELGG